MKRSTFTAALGAALLAPPRRAVAQSSNGRWTRARPLPQPRVGAAVAAVAGSLYVAGGYSPQGQRLNQRYNPSTELWTQEAPLPAALNYGVAVESGGRLYYFGGFAESPGIIPGGAVSAAYAYDPSGRWSELSPMPTPRGGAAAVVREGHIHVIGGRTKLDLSAHELYDPATDRWDTLAPLPTPRDLFVAVTAHGRIHVFGGRIFTVGANLDEHLVYDFSEDRWEKADPLPEARSAFTAAKLGGRVLFFGGETLSGVVATTLAWDPDRNVWARLASLPRARHSLGCGQIGTAVYVVGGSTAHGPEEPSRANDVFSFNE